MIRIAETARTLGRASLWQWVLIALLVSTIAQADNHPQTAEGWFAWASEARDRHSFVGEFIYQHGDNIESMRIWRAVDRNGEVRERLHSLSGVPREILRGDDSVTCILPNSDSLLIDKRQLQGLLDARIPADVSLLEPHYQLRLVGDDRVAGRGVVQIRLDPQDRLRYGYAVWFDRQTGLLLRAEVLDPMGAVIERLMMLDMTLDGPIAEADLHASLPTEGFTRVTNQPVANADDAASGPSWQMQTLPAGFALKMDKVQQLPGRSHPVRHLIYSDGLATVSVYIEPDSQADPIEGALQMGAMNAYGRAFEGHQAIVVGEVPAATVEQMAQALVIQSAR